MLNKKGQGVGEGLIRLLATTIWLAFLILGILNFAGLLFPQFATWWNVTARGLFPGATLLFLFFGAGLLGAGIDYVVSIWYSGSSVVLNSPAIAFFMAGIGVLIFGYALGIYLPHTAALAMILP